MAIPPAPDLPDGLPQPQNAPAITTSSSQRNPFNDLEAVLMYFKTSEMICYFR